MKKQLKTVASILIVLFATFIKGQTTIITENPDTKPWTDSSALLIEKYGLGNVWQYQNLLNISKADSLWFKSYERIIFGSTFINNLIQNINSRPINDSITFNFPDSTLSVFNKSYIQKRKLTVVWDAEGTFDSGHIGCTHRKIVATDRIKTISIDTIATCTFFTNKLTLFNDRVCNNYKVAFAQSFMESCDHSVSNYYKYLFTYNPSINYDNPPSELSSIINLQINPNPSPRSGEITISYYIPTEGNVQIQIQNAVTMLTQEIQNVSKPTGNNLKTINPTNIPSGSYYIKLIYQNQTFSKLLIIN